MRGMVLIRAERRRPEGILKRERSTKTLIAAGKESDMEYLVIVTKTRME